MIARERVERDQVFLGVFEQPADLRRERLQTTDDLGRTVAGLFAGLRVEDLSEGGGDQAPLVAAAVRGMSRTKCTVQRCQLQPRTRSIAAFNPSC